MCNVHAPRSERCIARESIFPSKRDCEYPYIHTDDFVQMRLLSLQLGLPLRFREGSGYEPEAT